MLNRIAILASACLALNAVPALAALGELNPSGRYNGQSYELDMVGQTVPQWKKEWSEAFFKCAELPEVKEMYDKMSNGEFKDIGPGKAWCQNSDAFKPGNVRLMHLGILKHLAGFESGYRDHAINPKSPNPPATGLFQMGPSDVEDAQCVTPEGKPIFNGQKYRRGKTDDPRVIALKDPRNNICCAMQIAAKKTKRTKGDLYLATGKKGVMGYFWEPMRDQRSSGARYQEMQTKVAGTCEQIGNPGGTFSTAEVEASRRVPAAGNPQYAEDANGPATATN